MLKMRRDGKQLTTAWIGNAVRCGAMVAIVLIPPTAGCKFHKALAVWSSSPRQMDSARRFADTRLWPPNAPAKLAG
jgi:hypothetical protein